MPSFRVLFVCVGNVCRSPVGERLLAARLPADRFEVRSAGMHALVDEPISPPAAALLEGYGGDPTGFSARQLDASTVRDSDLILVATSDLRSQLLSEWPAALRRTFTVREFAALLDLVDAVAPLDVVAEAQARRSEVRGIDYDIPDPFRRSQEAHELAASLMHAAVERIAKGLTR